jgi:hypothetical protein
MKARKSRRSNARFAAGAYMARLDRLYQAAYEHLQEAERAGKTRQEAAAELAAIAESVAADGDEVWAKVLREVSDQYAGLGAEDRAENAPHDQ